MSGSAGLDTNAYIALRAGDADAISLLNSVQRFLPVVVLGELLFGAGASGRAEQNRQLVEEFASNCTLLEITARVASRYADLRVQLRTAGRPIPDNDVWIAAACLDSGIPLITRDAHFSCVPGLTVLGW